MSEREITQWIVILTPGVIGLMGVCFFLWEDYKERKSKQTKLKSSLSQK
jgi:hypothetical protein